jgi:membrane-associated phospholipid phosphatase
MTSEIVGEGLLRQIAPWSNNHFWLLLWTFVSFLGSARFFTLCLPVVFAFEPPRRALRFASTVLGSAFIAEALKAFFARPRLDPILLGVPAPLEDPGLFANEAFPSGHALMAFLIWGDLLFHRRSMRTRLAGGALIVAIGFSRLALLRHDLLDIAGGFAFGAILLWCLWRADPTLARWAERPWQLLAGMWLVGCSLGIVGLPRPGMAIVLGVWAGVGAASAWSAARGWPERPPWQRLALAFLAVAVTLGWRWLLAPSIESQLAVSAMGYALLGSLVAGPLPRIRLPGR